MARVASCPQCDHDLLVPDGIAENAWVKCPECRAFFELNNATARELPTIVLADSDAAAPSHLEPAPPLDELTLEGTQFAQRNDAPSPADSAGLLEPAVQESPEAAAQRIDQWFRSAKTLEDLAPVSANADPAPETTIDPDNFTASHEPLDLTADDDDSNDVASLDDEFQLESAEEALTDAAAWDDSQHMDQLLADIENRPADAYEPAESEFDEAEEQYEEVREHDQANADWSPKVPLTMPPNEPRRKRSLIRTALVTVVGGVVGLALGYYALLWIRGPELDVLDVAKYLPKAALPASFQTAKQPFKTAPALPPSTMADDLAASDKVVQNEPAPETPPAAEQPAEKQATFDEPVAEPKKTATEEDRYATPAPPTETTPREPARLETPPATALTETAPAKNETPQVRIIDAPTFTLADLTASIQAANEAEATLAKGNLTDGRDVQQAKGKSYMAIADMAQKAALIDATAPAADVAKAESQVDDFLRRTFSNAHVSDELTQIVPKWLNHPKRPHNGIILAGKLARGETKGDVNEYLIDIGSDVTVSVLVPAEPGQAPNASTRPIAVAGWIVAKPADQVAGYTGTAPQAIFAKRLVPLE